MSEPDKIIKKRGCPKKIKQIIPDKKQEEEKIKRAQKKLEKEKQKFEELKKKFENKE